ncbi:MAG: SPOR domain-containing protein, partial [Betaproteobacteria bacterium]
MLLGGLAGSYTDLDTVREVRQKLERMGIKTYTQAAVIEGVTRVRVRVGPFSSRQEAQEVQAKIKAAGVAA